MSSDGRYIESQKIKYTITDGNKNIFKSDTHTDKSGKATLEVSIPGDVKKAPLFITCEARIEKNPLHFTNIIYPQPEKLNIGFYPEGGNIIAGTRKVVVVNATDLFGKPVGVEGVISDNNGNIITYFKTSESGYGKLLISAQSGEILHAKITKPSGIVQVYQLPEIKEKGISLSIYKTLNDSISFLIETGKNEEPADLKCLMQENGNIFWAGLVTIKKAGLIKIPIGNLFSGVAQLTIFDKNNDIVSQRLVYIDNLNKALIEAKTEGKEYSTRSKVKVNIKIKNIKLLNNSTSLSLSVCKTSLIDSFKNSGIYFSYLLNPELDNFLYSNKYEKIEDFKNTANLFLIANKYHRFSWEKVKNIMPVTQGFLT
jgi:hypothetical protein